MNTKSVIGKFLLAAMVALLLNVTLLVPSSMADSTASVNVIVTPEKEYKSVSLFYEGRAAVTDGKLYGYIDLKGQEIIPMQYEEVKSFSNRLAAVKKNGRWGFIDKEGNEVIQLQYKNVESFSEGLAVVEANGKFGYMNNAGIFVIEPKFSFAGSFSEGLANVQLNSKYGYIDKTGAIKISFKYEDAAPFSEGLAAVAAFNYRNILEYGYINKKGILSIYYEYSSANKFHDGRAIVRLDDFVDYAIDTNGKQLFQIWRYKATDYSEGLAAVDAGSLGSGYIDKSGKIVINLDYYFATPFSEGVAWVLGTNDMLIDKSNRVLLDSADISNAEWFNGARFANGLGSVYLKGMLVYISSPLDAPSIWAKDEIEFARSLNVVPLYLSYHYENSITREEFSKLIVNLLEVKLDKSIHEIIDERQISLQQGVFMDTSDRDVEAAYALGIVTGKGNDKFDPDGKITRQEAAVMLSRVANLLGVTASEQSMSFVDQETIATWAETAVDYITTVQDRITKQAVISSTGNDKFSPTATYTRQQAFITMKRLYQAIEE